MVNWEEIRQNYPLVKKGGYFNTASFGAISIQTLDNQRNHLDDLLHNGNGSYGEWEAAYFQLKSEMAGYLNCTSENVAFLPDVSNGINKVCELLPSSSEVILIREDFPSVTLPWITHGFNIRWIEYKDFTANYLNELEDKIKDGDKIVCLSWVFYNHGFRIDPVKVGELCKKYNATFILDATQGLGAFQLDTANLKVDFMVASCFKWFMAGYGIAVAYISPDFLRKFEISRSGWNVLKDFTGMTEDQDNYKHDASRFEIGHIKFQQISMLYSSFSEMKSIGFNQISARTKNLSLILSQKLRENGFEVLRQTGEEPSGIVSIKSNDQMLSKIKNASVACSVRKDYIRFAIYFYNNHQDIDDLIACLKH